MSYQGDFSFFLLFFCKRTFWTQTAKQVFPWGPLLEFFRSFHSPRHLSKLSWGRWSAVEMLGIAKSLDYNWTTAWSGSDATSWNQFKNAWPLFHTFCYKINKQTNRYGLRGFPHLYEMMEFLWLMTDFFLLFNYREKEKIALYDDDISILSLLNLTVI